MEWLFSWEVVSVLVTLLISIGLGALALDDFKLAKTCFLIAAADALGGVVMEGAKSNSGPWVKTLIVFLVAGGIGVLLTWGMKYVDVKKESKEAKEAALPDLHWSFGMVDLSDIESEDGKLLYPTGTTLQVIGTVTNAGPVPSIVSDWELNVRLVGESEFRPTELLLFGDSSKMIMGKNANAEKLSFKDGYLPEVTATTPVAAGAGKAGFMVFVLGHVPRESVRKLGTVVILSFRDVKRRKYSFDLTLEQHFTGPRSIPGIPRAQ
jgi:hypothetical protein